MTGQHLWQVQEVDDEGGPSLHRAEFQLDFTFYVNRQYFNGGKCDRNANLNLILMLLAFPQHLVMQRTGDQM